MKILRAIYTTSFIAFLSGGFVAGAGVQDKVPISQFYTSGSFLIYDCKKKSHICVDLTGKTGCVGPGRTVRRGLKQCLLIESFDTPAKCIRSQLKSIHDARERPECISSVFRR